MKVEKWYSVYIYYDKAYETCLIEVVKPLLKLLEEQSLISNFFYIKYWEDGPHIRLRVKTFHDVGPLISSFLDQKIEERDDITSFKWIDYVPEIDRYGGPKAIGIAELQFNQSSTTILSLLTDHYEEWDYDLAIGYAMELNINFAKGMGLSRQEAVRFFKSAFLRWFFMACNQLKIKNTDLLETFNQAFLKQKERLVSFVETSWNGSNHEQWRIANVDVSAGLKQLERSNQIVYPVHSNNANSDEPVWLIYDSLCHMTNNRLGILNRDESYIYFIIFNALSILNEARNLH